VGDRSGTKRAVISERINSEVLNARTKLTVAVVADLKPMFEKVFRRPQTRVRLKNYRDNEFKIAKILNEAAPPKNRAIERMRQRNIEPELTS